MTALKSIGIVLLILLLLLLLRVGVVVDFGETLCVRLRVGPVKRTILPKKKTEKTNEAEKMPQTEEKPKAARQRKLPKLSFAEWRDLARTILNALKRTLRRTCKRTRIDPLELSVVFAGGDPAEVAQTYGYANAVLWTLIPNLEELFDIPKPSIYLGTDFEKSETSAKGTVGVSLRVCDVLAILLTLAMPVRRWFLRYRRAHQNDPQPKATSAVKETEKTEKRTA